MQPLPRRGPAVASDARRGVGRGRQVLIGRDGVRRDRRVARPDAVRRGDRERVRVPFVRPSTTTLVAVPGTIVGPDAAGVDVTVYDVIVAPLSGGAVHETTASRSPPTARTLVGGSGAIAMSPVGNNCIRRRRRKARPDHIRRRDGEREADPGGELQEHGAYLPGRFREQEQRVDRENLAARRRGDRVRERDSGSRRGPAWAASTRPLPGARPPPRCRWSAPREEGRPG